MKKVMKGKQLRRSKKKIKIIKQMTFKPNTKKKQLYMGINKFKILRQGI